MIKYKFLLTLLTILITFNECKAKDTSKKIKVAVIDTGIHESLMKEKFLCQDGHKDFTKTSLNDIHGHGSHVSGLIDQHVKSKFLTESSISSLLSKEANYCQIIIKFFDPNSKLDPLDLTIMAFEHAISLKVDYINYSAGGVTYSLKEHQVIKKALDHGIVIVVAAGNNASNIDVHPYYPAKLDSRLIVVGNLSSSKIRAITSNYGLSVDVWEIGDQVLSLRTKTSIVPMSGTSQAAAIHTGKLIRKRLIVDLE